jgi:hypothetical protein
MSCDICALCAEIRHLPAHFGGSTQVRAPMPSPNLPRRRMAVGIIANSASGICRNFISVRGLYRYFPTKRSLVMFGLDGGSLEDACDEFFSRYERLKISDPPGAMNAIIRFVAQQVFFFRPTVVATLELVSDDLLSRIETMLSMGDKVIEELVLALPDARDRDWKAVARSIRRLTLAAYVERSMT